MSNQPAAEVLANHPSVQDLDIKCSGVNKMKVIHHTRNINAGPLVDPLAGPQGRESAKDQHVSVFRHEMNIARAKRGSTFGRIAPPKVVPPKPTAPPVELPTNIKPHQHAIEPPPPRNAARSSANSTVFSFEATDAASFSIYSCSCCHVAPPSSTCTAVRSTIAGSAVDTEDNMTSISQRVARSVSGVSVASSKLRHLEAELNRERADRKRTQEELEVIKQRQELLLKKLSDREREMLKEAIEKGRAA